MARDLRKEYEWERNKYKRFTIKVDKDVADKFLEKLGEKQYSEWFKEKINEFLK